MHTPSEHDEHLRVECRSDGPAVIVHAAGEVDMDTTPTLIEHLTRAADQVDPPAPVVADLRDIEFFGASGITALLEARAVCRQRRTDLRVLVSAQVLRPLTIIGVDTVLALRPTLTAALRPVVSTAAAGGPGAGPHW